MAVILGAIVLAVIIALTAGACIVLMVGLLPTEGGRIFLEVEQSNAGAIRDWLESPPPR